MNYKKRTLLLSLLLHIACWITQAYNVDYANYRQVPSDSTLYHITQCIKDKNLDKADSIYQNNLLKLKAENNFNLILFYANEYSYSLYTQNTRNKAKPQQTLKQAIEIAQPKLEDNNFELFLAEYNMNFYTEDLRTRIQWIKKALSHLDFDKYAFAKPMYSPMASLYFDLGENDSAWHYWDMVKEDTSLAPRFKAKLYFTIGAKVATFDSDMAIDFISQSMQMHKDSINTINKIKAEGMLTALYTQNADYEQSTKHGIAAVKLLERNKDLFSIQSLMRHDYWIHLIESFVYINQTQEARFWTKDMINKTKQFRNAAIANIRKDWIYGMILDAEEKYDSAQYYYDLSNQGFLHYTKDSLSNYITNGYYYKAEAYLHNNKTSQAIDYYKKAVVSFNHKMYTSINDDIKTIAPEKIHKPHLIFNIDMLLDLLEAYKLDYLHQPQKGQLEEILRISNYCNDLIKYRFRGIATAESALETSAYLKRSSNYGLFASYEYAKTQKQYIDSAFIFADLPRSFTLNYNKQLANTEVNDTTDALMKSIAKLNIRLINAKEEHIDNEQLFDIKYQLYRNKSLLTSTQTKDFSFMDNQHCLENLCQQLSPSDAVVQITCNDDSCYVICITQEEKTITCTPSHSLPQAQKILLRAIKTNGDWQQASHPFYQAFIAPFEAQIADKDQLALYIDERLQQIPFSLLCDDNNAALIERYAIKYHNSAKTYRSDNKPARSILIMAPGFEHTTLANNSLLRSTTADQSIFRTSGDHIQLSPLPFSISEAKAIYTTCKKKNIKSQLTTGKKASKAYFTNITQDYDILHLATHGIAANAYQTGLFFSPNRQSENASFISTNELYKQHINAHLVVLSACQSGLGEMASGEGIIGLPRSFMYAGAPNVIASLWKVHDANTQVLMTAFYKHLLNDNISYQKALQRAKLDCIKQGHLAMDWASFILIGE